MTWKESYEHWLRLQIYEQDDQISWTKITVEVRKLFHECVVGRLKIKNQFKIVRNTSNDPSRQFKSSTVKRLSRVGLDMNAYVEYWSRYKELQRKLDLAGDIYYVLVPNRINQLLSCVSSNFPQPDRALVAWFGVLDSWFEGY